MKYVALALDLALLTTITSIAAPADSPDARSPEVYARIYDRATNQFVTASFFKPDVAHETDAAFRYAPLIVQQTTPGQPLPQEAAFGEVELVEGKPQVRGVPTIYFHADTIRLQGNERLRLTYLWVYPARDAQMPVPQGLRITIGSEGLPVLWEPLYEESGAAVVYAGGGLERAAAREHGSVLPGRKFALERAEAERPFALIARVLEDGPVPMGPIVYVASPPDTIATVACRCMPSQAKGLVSTTTYRLVDFHSALPSLSPLRSTAGIAFWPEDESTDLRLEKLLRLPADF